MRPTADATPHQLKVASDIFKHTGFTGTRQMTLNELCSLYGGIRVSTSQPLARACEVWAALAEERANRKTAANFASRAKDRFIPPRTFRKLAERLKKGEMAGLEVKVNNMSPICLTSYSTSVSVRPSHHLRKMMKYPYFWGFPRKCGPREIGLPSMGFCRVNAIAFPGGSNLFIGVVGAKPTRRMKNTTYPNFLATTYVKKCRHAFEELAKLRMEIPKGFKEFAVGIGESRVDESGRSVACMTFRWNSHVFDINRFY